ncbi:MAG: ABC transporter permease [Lewinellaceae bacterium]|nr:ABC transporter permease [Lewinellaceae bacterium]
MSTAGNRVAVHQIGTVNYYFKLQVRIINRRFSAFGISPLPGYLLVGFAWAMGSIYLFQQTQYAPIIYAFLALGVISRSSEHQRNEFLAGCFPAVQYRLIRLLENGILALPFAGFLAYQGYWLWSAGLIAIAELFALIRFPSSPTYVLPTPFQRYPFEFIVGFRSTYLAYFLVGLLTYQAIRVGNFNLGIFAQVLTFLLGMTYYFRPEPPYFVWIFAANPRQFLWRKVGTAVYCASWFSLPVGFILGIAFPENIAILGVAQLVGYLLLLTIIFAKYAAFPAEINLPQAFLLGLGLWFPPVLLVIIPYFYRQALQRLQTLLT